ncbi:MAG: hypothetical protein AAGF12_11520 [Myxococcota bacterium]
MTQRIFLAFLTLTAACEFPTFAPPPGPVEEPATQPVAEPYVPPVSGLPHEVARTRLRAGGVSQLADAERIFDDAAPLSVGVVQGGLLVCSIQLTPEQASDTFSSADIGVRVRIGRRRDRDLWGPDGQSRAYVTMPDLRITPGERVRLAVRDRDLFFDDAIGRSSTRYQGAFPIVLEDDEFQAECRALDRATVHARVAPVLQRATAAVEATANLRPDLSRADFGFDPEKNTRALLALEEVDGWLGPHPAELRGLREQYDAHLEDFGERLSTELAEARSSLPAPGTDATFGRGIQARVVGRHCGAEAAGLVGDQAVYRPDLRCVVELELRNQRASAISVNGAFQRLPLDSVVVVDDEGKRSQAPVLRVTGGEERPGRQIVRPGGRFTALIGEPVVDARSPLLVGTSGQQAYALRVE